MHESDGLMLRPQACQRAASRELSRLLTARQRLAIFFLFIYFFSLPKTKLLSLQCVVWELALVSQ
jgi:hypothetical protein